MVYNGEVLHWPLAFHFDRGFRTEELRSGLFKRMPTRCSMLKYTKIFCNNIDPTSGQEEFGQPPQYRVQYVDPYSRKNPRRGLF